jgi:hypothetical protein
MESESTPRAELSETRFGIPTPEPYVTIPETEEYHFVSRSRLMELRRGRRDIVFEMFLVGFGAAIAAIVPAASSIVDWQKTDQFELLDLLNVVLLVAASTTAAVCWRIVSKKSNDFDETMTDILKGKRHDKRGNAIPLQSPSPRDGDNPS